MKKMLFLAVALISMQAFGQRYELGKGTKAIKIKSTSNNYELALNIPVYKIEDRIVVETVACRIPQCTAEQGDGSEGNWHEFFSVKTAQKPAALAAAIKGIGKVTAEKIVEFDLFKMKPDSWTEFKAYIKKIDKQLDARGYKYQFATNVIEVYGYENMIALGYGSEKSCTYVNSTCAQYSVKQFKDFSHYIERNLSVTVKNQTLQAFESDTVEITAGTERADVAISTSGYNKYQGTLLERGNVLELDATRIKRALPSDEAKVSLVKGTAGKMVMTLTIPAKFSAEDKDASIEATYEVCRADWFGGCFDVVGGPFKSTVSGTRFEKAFTTTNLKKGSNFFMRVRLNKVNSLFYSESKSDSITSNSIKM